MTLERKELDDGSRHRSITGSSKSSETTATTSLRSSSQLQLSPPRFAFDNSNKERGRKRGRGRGRGARAAAKKRARSKSIQALGPRSPSWKHCSLAHIEQRAPKSRRSRAHEMGIRKNKGKWTHEEHLAFLRGLHLYGRTWEAVASLVPTRTVLQIRTHSQKFFAKIDRGEVFPEEPYPSQYDAAAGKAGAAAGAYLYDVPPMWHQHQLQQQAQLMMDGNDATMPPEFLSLEPPPLRLGGSHGAEVQPCLPQPYVLVGGEKQRQALQAAESWGSAIPPGCSSDRLGRSSGASSPVKRVLTTSLQNSDDEDNIVRHSINIGRPQRNNSTAASAASFASSSALALTPSSTLSPQSFTSATPTNTSPAFGCAPGLPAGNLAVDHPASLAGAGSCQPSRRGEGQSVGISPYRQDRAGFNLGLEAGLPHGATGEAGCRADGAYSRQGRGRFDGCGVSGSLPQQQQQQHQQQQHGLGMPPALDKPPVWSISRDHETLLAEKSPKKPRQHGSFDRAERLDAAQQLEQLEQVLEAQRLIQQDILPFYGWFEGGVGADGDLGDLGGEEDGNADGIKVEALHPEVFGVL